jgi:hypothetical protein
VRDNNGREEGALFPRKKSICRNFTIHRTIGSR